MRISDWSSDVCSSDLPAPYSHGTGIGRQCCRDRADIRATRDNRHQHDDAGLTDPRPDIGRAAVVETANKAVVETENKAPVRDVATFRKNAPWHLESFNRKRVV